MKMISLLAGAVFLTFAYLFLQRCRELSPLQAAVITAICAVAPGTGELANNVMSELVFGAFTMGALWMLEREFQHKSVPIRGLALGALAGCALLTRSVGIALVAAILVGILWRRNWRLLWMTTVGLMLVVLPVTFRPTPTSQVARPYEYYVNYGDWFRHTLSDVGPHFLVWVPIKNLWFSCVGLGATMLPPRIEIFPQGVVLNSFLLGLLISSAFAVFFTIWGISGRFSRQPPDVWSLYLGFYLILLLIWPFPPPSRFFVPVLPLILLACRDGMSRSGWFTTNRVKFLVAGIGLLGLFTSSGFSAADRIGRARLPFETETHYRWLVENSAADDVIACIDDTRCYLLTGRKSVSIGIPDFASMYSLRGGYVIRPETVLDMLTESRARFLMIEETRGTLALEQLATGAVDTLRLQHPDLLEEIWRDEHDSAVIFRVVPEGKTTAIDSIGR